MTVHTPYRSRRQAAGLFGLLALWFQLVALAISPPTAQALAGDIDDKLVICTPNGVEVLGSEGGGSRSPTGHLACSCCVLGGCAALCVPSGSSAIAWIGLWTPAYDPHHQDQVAAATPRETSHRPRAPPIIA